MLEKYIKNTGFNVDMLSPGTKHIAQTVGFNHPRYNLTEGVSETA
uniref:Uncharacterized protein n=1 Tax=Arundo donax TaxID=35708 RepID=A0A0A9HXW9_ARUDO